MAFPNVTVEVAFDNDVNEYRYAQTGYTDITPYVRAISGDLRGRRYEMERVEAGSIQMTLDNEDGRFTPGKVSSPYYPNVKPARRVRVRGNNLQRMNIATTGSYDRSTDGFQKGNISPEPVLVETNPGLGLSTSHHIEITIPSGSTAQTYWMLMWNSPIEIGRRTAHSVKVWRVSGTEPSMPLSISTFYYDKDDNMLGTWDTSNWNSPTPTTPTLKYNAHTPPVNAAYAWTVLTCTPNATLTQSVTYAVAEIQTNNTPNLAPNPSGYLDADYWYVTGPNETAADYDGTEIVATMGTDDVELFTYVGGVVPGETYTAYVAGDWNMVGVNLLLTSDDGQSGTTWTKGAASAVLTFEAQSNPQRLSLMKADGTLFGDYDTVNVRAVNVQPGSTSPGAYVRGSDDDLLATWERPKPIFEGWIEAWPVRVSAANSEITVVANDRLARLGKVNLENTWREAFFADGMELIIPFDDDPVDAGGNVAQIGTWASLVQMIDVDWMATRGDLGSAGYVLGVDGPTDATASEWNPTTGSTVGYFLPIPFSKDYTAPAAPPAKPPAPKPPASTATYTYKTYTSRFYATWSRSYDGDNTTTWDDSAYMYQGYYSGDRGMTKSLAGFNYSQIKSTLAGATIKSCKVTLRNEHWYYNGGGKVYLGTHTYASKPSTWSDASVNQNRKIASCAKDGTVTIELGVTAGNEFKAGTTKGIALGPPPSGLTYYGFFRGATQSGRPYLTITYTKKVRVS